MKLAVLALLLVPALARAQTISGDYVGTWGPTTLHQDGDHITGTYAYEDGRIDGTLSGNTLVFAWAENDGAGHGTFAIADDGRMFGTWGVGDSDSNGGAWTLVPGVAAPSDTAPGVATLAPSALGWKDQLRMPFDFAFGDGYIDVGWVGLGFDLGNRVSPHWYAGASSEVSLMSLIPVSTASEKQTARLRIGGEVRYYFDEGVGAMTVNDGPQVPIPRDTWLGYRVGAESLDGFSTVGQFADLTLGTAFRIGGTSLGMYGAVGMSREPSSVYPHAMPTVTTITAVNIAIGIGVAFGS